MVNIAVIGSGYWGSKIVESLKSINNINKIQIIDIKNGQTIDSIDSDISAAIIATPLWDHHKTTIELLKRGLDCYVEKPLAENSNQITEIKQHSKDNIVMVGHIFLYHPALDIVKNNLHKIGTIKHIQSERLNWGIYQTKTTPLLSLLPHDVSIVLDLCKSINVTSVKQNNFSNNVVPDYVSFDFISENITGSITGSWYWPERVRKLTIIGTEGQIIWDDVTNEVAIFKGTVQNRRLSETTKEILSPNMTVSPLERELAHFINCVIERKQPLTGIQNALDVATVLDVVQERLN